MTAIRNNQLVNTTPDFIFYVGTMLPGVENSTGWGTAPFPNISEAMDAVTATPDGSVCAILLTQQNYTEDTVQPQGNKVLTIQSLCGGSILPAIECDTGSDGLVLVLKDIACSGITSQGDSNIGLVVDNRISDVGQVFQIGEIDIANNTDGGTVAVRNCFVSNFVGNSSADGDSFTAVGGLVTGNVECKSFDYTNVFCGSGVEVTTNYEIGTGGSMVGCKVASAGFNVIGQIAGAILYADGMSWSQLMAGNVSLDTGEDVEFRSLENPPTISAEDLTGAQTLNFRMAQLYQATIAGATAFTLLPPEVSRFVNLTWTVGADGGGDAVTFTTPIKWVTGVVPTWDTTVGGVNTFTGLWTGSEWLGMGGVGYATP